MVSKNKLRGELEVFNKELEKHLDSVDLSLLDVSQKSSGTSNDYDTMLLLSENLKEIRYEISMMRKNLSSDVSTMVGKELNSVKQELFQEFNSMQQQMFEFIKSFDMSTISHIQEDVASLQRQQNTFEKHLQEIPSQASKVLREFSSVGEKHLKEVSDNIESVQTQLSNKFSTSQSSVHSLEKDVSNLSDQVKDVAAKMDTLSDEFVRKASEISNGTYEVVEGVKALKKTPQRRSRLKQLNDSVELSLVPQQNVSSSEEKNDDSDKENDTFVFPSNNSSKKILSIDEKLSKLDELR